jgi:alkylhydroperoxidase family enzyme
MARLPYLDVADAEPQVRAALEKGLPLGIFRMLANAQGAYVPWLRFGAACLDGREFDALLRELAILRVARLTPGAEYEWVQHADIARRAGATEEQLSALEHDDVAAACFGADARLVLAFTTEVVVDGVASDTTFAAMTGRFTPREIMHLLLVIGQYMMLGRIMATVQLDMDPVLGPEVLATVDAARDRLAEAAKPDGDRPA